MPFRLGEQKLVVFEDSEVLHRTPLTARAFPDILSRRPIVRIDFYGTSSKGKGGSMAFRQPADGATPWRPLECVTIPSSLSKVCEAHAADKGSGSGSGGGGGDDAVGGGAAASAAPSQEALLASLECYLKDTPEFESEIAEYIKGRPPAPPPQHPPAPPSESQPKSKE